MPYAGAEGILLLNDYMTIKIIHNILLYKEYLSMVSEIFAVEQIFNHAC